ncbi:hypothetical protein HZS_7106, partial [Henneguya salminicola]
CERSRAFPLVLNKLTFLYVCSAHRGFTVHLNSMPRNFIKVHIYTDHILIGGSLNVDCQTK